MVVVEDEVQFDVRPFVHLSAENVLIMPYNTLQVVFGDLRSIGIRLRSDAPVESLIEDYLVRITGTLFAGLRDGEQISVASYTSMGITSVEGMEALLVPMLIAALIVLNAMMGAVYERFREIGIYSSVGLAPMHIALLFIAEACVYAVIGVTLGYLFGQGLGKVLVTFDLLSGLSLNYSSLAAIVSALMVMAVVMLSTVYPSRKASQLAVPDVTRRWRLPTPDGDRWHFEFPFTVSGQDVLGLCVFLIGYFDSYSEESIGTFYTDGAELGHQETPQGEGYTIDMNIWLAPFDLGVSQHVVIRALPVGEHNIFQVELDITRLSGEDASWRRVNQRFMNVIRKQFLIWRTVDGDSKSSYRAQGAAILASEQTDVGV